MAELDGWYLRGIWCATSPRCRCHCCFCKTLLSHLAASGNLLEMSCLWVRMDSVLFQYVLCVCSICRHFALLKVVCIPKPFFFAFSHAEYCTSSNLPRWRKLQTWYACASAAKKSLTVWKLFENPPWNFPYIIGNVRSWKMVHFNPLT